MPEADPGKRPPLLSRWGPVLLLLAMGLLVVALGVGVVRQFSGGPTSGYSSAIGGPFTMTDQNGRTVTLGDLCASTDKGVIVYFYPKACTPGCTKEACDFRDSLEGLKAACSTCTWKFLGSWFRVSLPTGISG